MLAPDEVARVLGVSRWIESGLLPAVKRGEGLAEPGARRGATPTKTSYPDMAGLAGACMFAVE
jgi:hypothetical protein